MVVILGLLAYNLFGGRIGAKIDESLSKSIAVLPFHNFSTDPDQEQMCLGLTNEIIGHLFKIKSFKKVTPLTSVLTYIGSDKRSSEISEELEVNYILEGTYTKIGEQLRVTVKLVEPKKERQIWQHEYDQPYNEIISLQSDIALQIADHLKAFLSVSEKENIQKIPTANPEAYELLQKGLYLMNTRGREANSQVLDLALEAIRLDPDYADAYAGAGLMALWNGAYSGTTDMQHAAMEALPYFEKALELDQYNATAHNAMAQVNLYARWDYVRAEKEFLRSLDLEPNNSGFDDGHIEFSLQMGQIEKALKRIDKVQGYSNSFFAIVSSHILSDNKIEAYKLLAQASTDKMAQPFIGEAYLWMEEYDSAIFYLESALQSEHYEMPFPRWQAKLAFVYEKTNNHLKARTIVNQLIAKSDTTSAGSPAYFTGWYYSGIGEVDSAFHWLEKAYNNRSPELPWLKVDPAFNNLKDDDRYWDLYERTGHKDYDDYMASKSK
jgi:TolB-like protein/Tfp pilus assembly protein PilF